MAFPVDYGSIVFKMHRSDTNSEFIRCRPNANKRLIVNHAFKSWNLPTPGVLMRVTGSTTADDSNTSSSDWQDKFDEALQGVLQAANTASAWLFSTGLDFGISSALGTALGRSRHHCDCPMIGFAQWQTVQGLDQLQKDAKGRPAGPGAKRAYTDCAPDADMSTVSLQAHHTHFVLVGMPKSEMSAEEVKALEDQANLKNEAKAAALLAGRKRSYTYAHEFEYEVNKAVMEEGHALVPRVLVVICGDKTTLSEVVTYCTAGDGVVVCVSNTGGLAAALMHFVFSGQVPAGWAAYADQFQELKALNAAKRKVYESEDDPALKHSSSDWPLFAFTDDKRGADALTEVILDQVTQQTYTTLEKITDAVHWDDPKRLQNALTTMIPSWREDRTEILRVASQLALQMERPDCVEVLIRNAAPVKDIDLLALYDKLYDPDDGPRYPLYVGKTLPSVARAEQLKAAGAARMSAAGGKGQVTTKNLFREISKSTPLADKDIEGTEPLVAKKPFDELKAISEYYPMEVWQTLQEVVPGLCLYWVAKLKKLDEESSSSDTAKKLGARWIDVYVWSVLLGNVEMAQMLLPACQEPMRAAVIGARLFNWMAAKLPLDAVNLKAHAASQEEWALSLLDLCDNFTEARRMLVTRSRHWNRTVLHLAVQSGLRNFCAHTHCQTLCDQWLSGNQNFDKPQVFLTIGVRFTLKNMLSIWGFAALPIPQLWGRDMIAWTTPTGVTPMEGKPPVAQFYEIPIVKQMMRLFWHLMYTFFTSYITMETNLKSKPADHEVLEFHQGGGWEKWYMEGILIFWTVSLIMDEWYKYIQSPSSFQMEFWNWFDYATLTATSAALIIRVVNLQSAVEVMAFITLLIWIRLFKYLMLSNSIGILVIMIMEMFKDIVLWALVSMVFLGAYTVAFVSISDPDVAFDSTGDHPLTVPLWAMMGYFNPEEVHTWNVDVGQIMLWSYLVIANIVLVNLLIAMMGYTFGEIKEKSDEEWKFSRLRSSIETTERMSPVPPPFNLPITLGAFIMQLMPESCQNCVKNCIPAEETDPVDPKAESIAKKAKRKVARRLLLALKRKNDHDEATSMDGLIFSVNKTVQALESSLTDVARKLSRVESAMRTAGIHIESGMRTFRGAGAAGAASAASEAPLSERKLEKLAKPVPKQQLGAVSE